MKSTLLWIVRILIFTVLFSFALQNTQTVTLTLFLDYRWQAPLVLVLVVFFSMGLFLGLLSLLPTLWRHKRQARLKKKTSQVDLEAKLE